MFAVFSPWIPVLLSIVMVVGFGLLTKRTHRITGENPYRLVADDSPMGYCGRVYKLTTLAMAGFLGLRIFFPAIDSHVGYLELLNHPEVYWAGVAITGTAVLWALYAQYYMAASWRIGIPDDKPGDLVDTGPFGISRNPFFTGVLAFNFGLFITVPTAVTLACWLVLMVVIPLQVRLEEGCLKQSIGAPYENYMTRVRRWL